MWPTQYPQISPWMFLSKQQATAAAFLRPPGLPERLCQGSEASATSAFHQQ